jgi:serine O-acetyltransferase
MDDSPARWAQKLIESYRDDGGVNTSNEPGLPSKPEIASLCLQIMQLLFPGYHDIGSIGKSELSGLTLDRVKSLTEDLHRAFRAGLSASACRADNGSGAFIGISVKKAF